MATDWRHVTLGDFITLQRGHDLPTERRSEGGVPILGSFGITGWHNEAKAKGPGVTVGRSGGSIGVVSYTEDDYWPLNTALYVKDFHGNHERFAYYFLQTLNLAQYNSGSAQPSLNRNHIHPMPISVPAVEEQKAIADALGALDDKIELNRQINTTLESMAQALFKSWFVDFDPVIDNALAAGNDIPEPLQVKAAKRKALGANRKPLPDGLQQQFPDRFVFTEEMGWVPEGWDVLPVSDAIFINPKVSLKKGTLAPFVDMKALPTSGYSVDEISEKAFSGGAKFEVGDVLLARITPCLENGKTAVVDFLGSGQAAFGSTEFIVLRPKGEISTPFVASLARDANFRQHCITNMVGSSGRQRVQNSCFDSYFLALPTEGPVLQFFTRNTEPWFLKMTQAREEIKALSKLRDTLLPKLLSGEVRIPDAEKQLAEVL